ncbi:SDR family oxidoreductase [Bordetella sp. BOR01]|uniref:SDR family oxidoreductase n=1 Tax=Bordetella sp. BOR01 TaxID=2854779 RepID=UPI001C49463D|nr:SDR family oxidoreductase [Bordetella sp. BOR01]MBV7485367.1 SDR family oxidoreductase [Bordetella sp. BOR01]
MNITRLDGKTVAITGAGRGIGAAVVLRLLELEARVIAMVQPGTRHPDLDAIPAALAARLSVVPIDVTSTESVSAAAAKCRELAKGVDVLVNNAGIIEPIGKLADVDPDRWAQVLAVNAGGAMRCARAFLPMLIDRQGALINMSSGAAYKPMEGWSAYCASKAALVMVSRSIDLEYRTQGVRMFSLGIPPTDTSMQASIRHSGINEVSLIPQGELHPPAKTAEVVAWLCSPEARGFDKLEIDVRDEAFAPILKEWQ